MSILFPPHSSATEYWRIWVMSEQKFPHIKIWKWLYNVNYLPQRYSTSVLHEYGHRFNLLEIQAGLWYPDRNPGRILLKSWRPAANQWKFYWASSGVLKLAWGQMKPAVSFHAAKNKLPPSDHQLIELDCKFIFLTELRSSKLSSISIMHFFHPDHNIHKADFTSDSN